MTIKSIIIDDEPLAINVVKSYLEEIPEIQLVNTFENAIEGLNFLQNNQIDLIFLDINMPLLDGINFLETLKKKPLVIVISAHPEYAVKTYELDVLDYLTKPIPFPRFMKSIQKVYKTLDVQKIKQFGNQERPYLFVKVDKKKMQKIYLDDILVIECLKDYLKIITTTNNYIIHQTLSNFTNLLPSDNFIRIHRSYTIAINKIDTIEGNSIEIAGIRYVIGRTYTNSVKSAILKTAANSNLD